MVNLLSLWAEPRGVFAPAKAFVDDSCVRHWVISEQREDKLLDIFLTSAPVARLRSLALGTTALSMLSLVPVHAANAAPPANSLPGGFSTNAAGVTYTGNSATGGTIATVGGLDVLQWGGATAQPHPVAPGGTTFTTNPGFSIGQGGTLHITGASTSVLVSDQTGSPSQIFGALDAGALGGPLFVSNGNGVIVGGSGAITAPAAGIGLLGYRVDPVAFLGGAGTVTVDNNTTGTGSVKIMAGATINGGDLLVASNDTVNIGATAPGTNWTFVMAGFGFTTGPGGTGMVAPQAGPNPPPPTTLTNGRNSVVNFTPAAANGTLYVDQIAAAGAVNNSGNLELYADGPSQDLVVGLFTNGGTLTDKSMSGDFANNQFAGGLTNTGTINAAPGNLVIRSAGNVQNKGVLNLAAAGDQLLIEAANIDLEGSVLADSTALSPNNPLGGLVLQTLGANGTVANPANIPQTAGIIDLATSIFTNDANTVTVGNAPIAAYIAGNAIRVLPNGNVFATAGNIGIFPGTNAGGVPDPFYNLSSLNYNFGLFPGTLVQATRQHLRGKYKSERQQHSVFRFVFGEPRRHADYAFANLVHQCRRQ